ncbi:hypothetical protein KDU71_14670 [Carboxylicivirga sediminis]|uniref:Uncharacterized protein n=1 Tax=Carboxylicivirga sediminis TaxID=2006564 RepID=A0A941F710_9BACT|nr:hypothetical protein [Carboxylicivirga sediminis]MBR8536815.1 hypothetical protein [Carboxylicivirga sediminis]
MNNTFNINRFGKLLKQQYQLAGKTLALALASIFIGYTLILLIFTFNNAYIATMEWLPFFIILNSAIALPFAAYAFPAFRSKEKTFDFLLLPCSVTEKFTLNLIIRIIAPWIVLPVIFYISSRLATELALWYFPQSNIEGFRLWAIFSQIDHDDLFFAIVSIILTGLIHQSVLFTGATVFRKQPLIKTLLILGAVAGIIIFYFYIIIGWVEIYKNGRIPWFAVFENNENTVYYLIGVEIALLITTLAYAFYRVKEKEIA